MKVANLRSPYTKTAGIYFFARMIDKIKLHARKELPDEYQPTLGNGFDGKLCRFLRVNYGELVERVLGGGADDELLEWCFSRGYRPSDEEIEMWNEWMRKYGWNDRGAERVKIRLQESGLADRTDIQTMFDYIDLDEGRDPRSSAAELESTRAPR
jgi:hypothetical protein